MERVRVSLDAIFSITVSCCGSHPLALECSDVRLVGQEPRKRVLELRRITVARFDRQPDGRVNLSSRSRPASHTKSRRSKRSVGLGLPLGKSPLNLPRGPASESTRPPLRQGCATSAVRQARPPSRCGPASGKHPNIRTSHPLALECSDVRLVGQEPRKRVLELRCPVTVPREIGSLSRMNDDGTNIIVSQQRRDLVFGDWTSAMIFVPRRVWIGEKLPLTGCPSTGWRVHAR